MRKAFLTTNLCSASSVQLQLISKGTLALYWQQERMPPDRLIINHVCLRLAIKQSFSSVRVPSGLNFIIKFALQPTTFFSTETPAMLLLPSSPLHHSAVVQTIQLSFLASSFINLNDSRVNKQPILKITKCRRPESLS